ncbi:hypothetical protein BH10PSE1_BH10PSE1_19630 [soil metagenome]
MKQSSLVVGVDVPWVTSWTAETILGPGPCPSLDGGIAILQSSNAGFGKPEYSKNHVVRQRHTVRRMLCPMCGEPTTEGDRVTQVARRIPAGWVRAGGRTPNLPSGIPDAVILLDTGSIAPLHRHCSERSLIHCPHLRASPNVEVMDFTTRWVTMPLLVNAVMPPPASAVLMLDPPRARPVTAVTFLQICGVTDDSDPAWRTNAEQYRGAGAT